MEENVYIERYKKGEGSSVRKKSLSLIFRFETSTFFLHIHNVIVKLSCIVVYCDIRKFNGILRLKMDVFFSSNMCGMFVIINSISALGLILKNAL